MSLEDARREIARLADPRTDAVPARILERREDDWPLGCGAEAYSRVERTARPCWGQLPHFRPNSGKFDVEDWWPVPPYELWEYVGAHARRRRPGGAGPFRQRTLGGAVTLALPAYFRCPRTGCGAVNRVDRQILPPWSPNALDLH